MRALIIGGGGFVGSFLAAHLQRDKHWETWITKLPQETVDIPNCVVCDLDILHQAEVTSFLTETKPDVIFHLAAQSSVAYSWKNPQMTVEINILGSLRMLDAIRDMPNYTPHVLLIGSSEEYGVLPPDVAQVSEGMTIAPENPYAITKAAQNRFGYLYAKAYGMHITMIRAFNHIGPLQAPLYSAADFCKQAAEIALGQRPPQIHVGNLSAARDFTDVRDVVRAYGLLAEYGRSGETYNVGSGKAIPLQDLLAQIIQCSGVEIEVVTDPTRLRPVEVPVVQADIRKLKADTGWSPEIPLEQTIREMLAYWRTKALEEQS